MPLEGLAFVAVFAATQLLPARMRDGVVATLSNVVALTGVLMGGTPLAIASAGGALASWRMYTNRRVQRTLFNVGQVAIAAAAAGVVFTGVGGTVDAPGRAWNWLALLVAAVAYTMVNNMLVAVAIRLSSGERIRSTLRSILGSAMLLQVLYAGLAVLAAALLVGVGPIALALLVVPALVARSSLLGFQRSTEAYDRLVGSLLKAIEVKDGYTAGHTDRVATLCVEVGRALGFEYEQLRAVRYAAKLHDVGKLGVPLSIINKPAALDEDEFAHIHEHPIVGAEILAEIGFLHPALEGIRYHHERLDGKGYPFGLSGDGLPMVARVITACDAFDAMTTTRPYRRAMELDDAFAELQRHAGTQFDPEVIGILERVVERLDWQPTYEAYGEEPAGLDRTESRP
ncbi:MAG: HD-GYP domain-containing protein [Nitriliruptorales bacterium]